MENFSHDPGGLFQDDTIHEAHVITAWFDEHENYVNHMMSLQSPDLNPAGRFVTFGLENTFHRGDFYNQCWGTVKLLWRVTKRPNIIFAHNLSPVFI